jgi:hypothetical protein
MSNARKFVIWTRDYETDWEPVGEPLDERDAVRQAREIRDAGCPAKALPLGTKPEKAK